MPGDRGQGQAGALGPGPRRHLWVRGPPGLPGAGRGVPLTGISAKGVFLGCSRRLRTAKQLPGRARERPRSQGAILGSLGSLLGRLGAVLGPGPSWGVLVQSWADLGVSWGVSGPSWGRPKPSKPPWWPMLKTIETLLEGSWTILGLGPLLGRIGCCERYETIVDLDSVGGLGFGISFGVRARI